MAGWGADKEGRETALSWEGKHRSWWAPRTPVRSLDFKSDGETLKGLSRIT